MCGGDLTCIRRPMMTSRHYHAFVVAEVEKFIADKSVVYCSLQTRHSADVCASLRTCDVLNDASFSWMQEIVMTVVSPTKLSLHELNVRRWMVRRCNCFCWRKLLSIALLIVSDPPRFNACILILDYISNVDFLWHDFTLLSLPTRRSDFWTLIPVEQLF